MTGKPKLNAGKTNRVSKAEKSNAPITEVVMGEVQHFLAGYKDDDGAVHLDFTIREMDGRDEEAVAGADVKNNEAKAIHLILERCITSIGPYTRKSVGLDKWKSIIKGLLVSDQDRALLLIRALSLDGEFEMTHQCPKCAEKLKTFISADEFPVVPFSGKWEIPFELPRGYVDSKGNVHKKGFIRYSTGLDREIILPMSKTNLSKAKTLMMTRLCTFEDEDVYVTEDLFRGLVVRDREYLGKLIEENSFGLDLTTEVTCTSCGSEFKAGMTTRNFL